MKILVLSDSHSVLGLMRRFIEKVKPDAVIHLGDHYDDGQTLSQEYPHIQFHQVPGNCDRYRCPSTARTVLCYDVGGARLFMTHGHEHHVKQTLLRLLADARSMGAAAALYGHTHIPDCHREEDGLWVLNPGSCGSWGGSAGIIETADGLILSCRILGISELGLE